MSVVGLRVEDRLAEAGNWSPWKVKIVLILEELELWDIVENPMVPPIDALLLAEFKKMNCYEENLSMARGKPQYMK